MGDACVSETNGVAHEEFGVQGDEGDGAIDDDGLGVLVEGAAFAGKTVNHDGYAHGDTLAGARCFLFGGCREGNSKRWLDFLRGPRVVERGDLHCFLGNALLGAVLATLEFPSLLKDLFEGFLAVRKGNPGVAVPTRAPEPDGEVPRHESYPRILMIHVCRECGGGHRVAFPER